MNPLLPYLVNENQLAFTQDRSIQDNMLLVYEVVKRYQKIGGLSSYAIKVDVMKSFDIVH